MAITLRCDNCYNSIPTKGLPSAEIFCKTCHTNKMDDMQEIIFALREKISRYEKIFMNMNMNTNTNTKVELTTFKEEK
jgi:hypothetical protein